MTWTKLDDRMHSHRKVVAAGNEAVGLWVRLLTWCAANGTDGDVPTCVAQMFGDASGELCARLVEVGLLDLADGGYSVHDFLDYNPSAKDCSRNQEQRREAGKRGAMARWQTDGESPSQSHANRIAPAMAKRCPVPDPVPDPNKREGEPRKRGPVKVARPDDWRPDERCRAIAQEWNLDLSLEVQSFLAWTDAGGYRYADWQAAFRNHLARARKQQSEQEANRHARFALSAHEQTKAEARKEVDRPALPPGRPLPALPRPEAGPAVPPPPGLLDAIRGVGRAVP